MKKIYVGDTVVVHYKMTDSIINTWKGWIDRGYISRDYSKIVDIIPGPPEPPKVGETWTPKTNSVCTHARRIIAVDEGYVFYKVQTSVKEVPSFGTLDWFMENFSKKES